jgi:light-regulated signal transduction histidine kinase (bacteriophytochrome)
VRKKSSRIAANVARQKALLIALSDDLTLPLLQIKTSLDLLERQDFKPKLIKQQSRIMGMSVETGLHLAEAYRLVLHTEEIQELPLEPVAIGAILDDVAHQLSPYAKEYSTDLQVDVQRRLTPVLAHQPSLRAALECLSTSLIRAQAAQTQQPHYQLLLGAHRSANNLVAAGVFTNVQGLSDRTLRAARALAGHARQPLPALPSGAASGVLIADLLCSAMWQPLRAAAHKNMPGLAVGVPASKQLRFV